MNDQRPVKRQPSLLERAADMFGLDPAKNASTIDVSKLPPEPEKRARKAKAEPAAKKPDAPADANGAPADGGGIVITSTPRYSNLIGSRSIARYAFRSASVQIPPSPRTPSASVFASGPS